MQLFKYSFLFYLVALTLTSCVITNYTRNKVVDCSVHHSKLKKQIIRQQHSPPSFPSADCPYNKLNHCSLGCNSPRISFVIRLAKVYVCDSCTIICADAR